MMTFGQKRPYPYQVLADFCDSADLKHQKKRLDELFYAAHGVKSDKVLDCPVDITYHHKVFKHLLKHLHRLIDEKFYPHKIITYREWAIPKMIKNIRRLGQRENEPSFFSHTPYDLTFAEIHQPYPTLFKLVKWKSFKKWKKILYNWQVSALTNFPEKTVLFEKEYLEAYRILNKIIDVCYLIYTVELDSDYKADKPFYPQPLLHRTFKIPEISPIISNCGAHCTNSLPDNK